MPPILEKKAGMSNHGVEKFLSEQKSEANFILISGKNIEESYPGWQLIAGINYNKDYGTHSALVKTDFKEWVEVLRDVHCY